MSRLPPLIAVLGISGMLAPSPGRAAESPCGARVLQNAARGDPAPVRQRPSDRAAASPPAPLLVLAAASVAVLAAGVLGFLVRRSRRAS